MRPRPRGPRAKPGPAAPTVTTPRLAALQVLLAIDQGRTTLAAELDRVRGTLADERDRALLGELATGTLRWRAELDALLAACSHRPLADLTPALRGILRLAAYQLEHLDRVPAHAVLHEAVEMARVAGEPRAAGFVNAVLRTLVRKRSSLVLPASPAGDADRGEQVGYLSTRLSHPEWLAARWLDRVGFHAAARWCTFNNAAPDVTIRPARGLSAADLLVQLRDAGLDARPAVYVPDAIVLAPGMLGRLPASLTGAVIVQDEASQVVAHAVGATPATRVLDLCAAPGAKTIVMAADQQFAGTIVASDYRASRVRLLRGLLQRAGVEAPVVRLDATKPLPFGPVFDRVFVDAPCSGLGIIRRDPDVKWLRQPDDLPAFALVQQRLLANAAEAVAPGGLLVYATCSSEPEENDQVLDAFLASDDRFTPARLTVAAGSAAEGLLDAAGRIHTLPFRDGLDAFFAGAARRR